MNKDNGVFTGGAIVLLLAATLLVSHNVVYGTESEITMMYNYCLEHADRAAAGEHILQDLVHSGMLPSVYGDRTCDKVMKEKSLEDARMRIMCTLRSCD